VSSNRRTFLKNVAGLGLVAGVAGGRAMARLGGAAQSAAHIEILPGEPLGRIAPELYGHFIEHLGGVIYDGVWVGENSKVPNVGGIRKSLIDALKRINAPVVRWPGGCFADSYDWNDGLGKDRPVRTNFWGGPEPNEFGTEEFMRLCALTGAAPYVAANLRGLPAMSFQRWVEYCNSPEGSTTGARLRAAHGHAAPYGVKYWGVGNESWGCGGNFTPEEYASEFRRFVAWLPVFDKPLSLVASGPSDHDVEWTRRLFHALAERGQVGAVGGLSMHMYTWNVSGGATTDWDKGKGDGLKFNTLEWYELLSQGDQMERLIRDHWAVMGEFDREHRIKLVVDEWGSWYAPGSEVEPASKYKLSQMLTQRDALLTGLTLDIFQRHPEKVGMANAAQLVNCLHSLMLASGGKFTLTPVYHVFDMYKAHMGAQAVRTEFAAPRLGWHRPSGEGSLWGLNGSASVSGKTATLTVVNPSTTGALESEIVVRGAAITGVSGQVLATGDIHAHNDFAHPDAVKPGPVQASAAGGRLVYAFPPASVTALTLTLA
jgi:alpha-N-arabinofuranosidase